MALTHYDREAAATMWTLSYLIASGKLQHQPTLDDYLQFGELDQAVHDAIAVASAMAFSIVMSAVIGPRDAAYQITLCGDIGHTDESLPVALRPSLSINITRVA